MSDLDSMALNFERLYDRVFNALNDSDLDDIFSTLKKIDGPTLITGVGGSAVVSAYMRKVLCKKNHIIANNVYPRDVKYMDLSGYKNVVAVSYSGGNIGVDVSFENDLNHYLFSTKCRDGVNNMQYVCNDIEKSYISLAATLIPLSILFLYYTDNNLELLKEIFEQKIDYNSDVNDVYEIMSGYESYTAAIALESSMTETGIGTAVIHEKYNYCHGRTNLHIKYNSELIFFKSNNELDNFYSDLLPKVYKKVDIIERKYEDDIINDYYWTYLTYFICRQIALKKNIDMGQVEEASYNDKFYLFKGKM